MNITDSQIFIATFLALVNAFLALRLGSTLYNS
uniref:Photosystem I reaction center subunit XII n=1 Tax=Pedobesia claviformis TaxID=2364088 RepID=A0A386B0W4_9CHLO|nr:photosystem I reaction center subunit M [Pedobesia claviformis]AYC65342.1 photosystem I reaction center subunit M [Pedobesia claviformis]